MAIACLVIFFGCNPYMPSASASESVLLKVECRDAPNIRQSVMLLLHSGRAKDIMVRSDGSSLEITAAFILEDTPPSTVESIALELKNLNGVVRTEILENHSVVRQKWASGLN
jgi:hypothetical protein